MDDLFDIERQRFCEWLDARRFARQEYCEKCTEHNESCPYYDAEVESWDYDLCFEEGGD